MTWFVNVLQKKVSIYYADLKNVILRNQVSLLGFLLLFLKRFTIKVKEKQQNYFIRLFKENLSWTWWCTTLLVLRKLRQGYLYVFNASEVYRVISSYIVRNRLNTNKKKETTAIKNNLNKKPK